MRPAPGRSRQRSAGYRFVQHRFTQHRFTRGGERGAVAMELVVLVPAIVLVLGVLTAGWRLWSARTQVADAASAAARAATLESSAGAADQRARAVARADLAAVGVDCEPSRVEVDVGAFALPPGQPGTVRVDASCTVRLSDLVAPGLPGQWQVQASRSHPLDTFRERANGFTNSDDSTGLNSGGR